MRNKINGLNRKIGDIDSFLFTNKNNKWTKYSIKKENKYDAFVLHSQQDPKLFTFGNDLIIYKEELQHQSFVNERNCFFDYERERNCLIGKIGTFSIKYLKVIQLE